MTNWCLRAERNVKNPPLISPIEHSSHGHTGAYMTHTLHRWRAVLTRPCFKRPHNYRRLLAVAVVLLLLVVLIVAATLHHLRRPRGPFLPSYYVSIAVADAARPYFSIGTEKDYMMHRPDGRNGTVRVMTMFLATNIPDHLCYAVASAYFADLPVVVAGHNKTNFRLSDKPYIALHAAEMAGLDDRDVVLALDSDIFFSGQDMLPYIDRFIAQSAASPRALDAKAVREGRAMAPVMFAAENFCYIPQLAATNDACAATAAKVESHQRQYAVTHRDAFQPRLNPPDNPLRYINTGLQLYRIWALRTLTAAMTRYTRANRPAYNGPTWWCDQSIIHALNHDLLEWEMAQNVYFNATAAKTSTQYGLPAGLIAMDWSGQLAVSVAYNQASMYELTSERWDGKASNTLPMYDKEVTHYVKALYAAARDVVHFTHRPFTRTFSHVRSTDVAPPLLSVTPYHTPGSNATPAARIFPYMTHFCAHEKFPRIKLSMQYMPWYLPMMFDQDQWEKGRDYLLSMPMELWSATRRVRVRYADVCPQHPFSVRPNWS